MKYQWENYSPVYFDISYINILLFCSYKASEYNISAVVLGYSASCHRLVEETLSVCDLGHWQCYQKACYKVRNVVLKWVLPPPCQVALSWLEDEEEQEEDNFI